MTCFWKNLCPSFDTSHRDIIIMSRCYHLSGGRRSTVSCSRTPQGCRCLLLWGPAADLPFEGMLSLNTAPPRCCSTRVNVLKPAFSSCETEIHQSSSQQCCSAAFYHDSKWAMDLQMDFTVRLDVHKNLFCCCCCCATSTVNVSFEAGLLNCGYLTHHTSPLYYHHLTFL